MLLLSWGNYSLHVCQLIILMMSLSHTLIFTVTVSVNDQDKIITL